MLDVGVLAPDTHAGAPEIILDGPVHHCVPLYARLVLFSFEQSSLLADVMLDVMMDVGTIY